MTVQIDRPRRGEKLNWVNKGIRGFDRNDNRWAVSLMGRDVHEKRGSITVA